jgi:hypothetical protein
LNPDLPDASTAEEDLEDARLGAAALEAHRRSGKPGIPLQDVLAELGLDPSDI